MLRPSRLPSLGLLRLLLFPFVLTSVAARAEAAPATTDTTGRARTSTPDTPAAGTPDVTHAAVAEVTIGMDSAAAHRLLIRHGYGLDGVIGVQTLQFRGPDAADLRIVFLDGRVALANLTVHPADVDQLVAALLTTTTQLAGRADSLSRLSTRWTDPATLASWRDWPRPDGFVAVWHHRGVRTEMLAQRAPTGDAPQPIVLYRRQRTDIDVAEAVTDRAIAAARREVRTNPKYSEPLVGDRGGPMDPFWIPVIDRTDFRVAVEPPSRLPNGHRSAWVRLDQARPFEGVQFLAIRWVMDCRRQRYQVTHESHYGPDSDLVSQHQPKDATTWKAVEPGDGYARVAAAICAAPLSR